MESFSVMIRDVVIIGVLASFCEMLLPESDIKHPVRLIFGLYFMALLLGPMVALVTDTDLSALDVNALAETRTMEAPILFEEDMVYAEAADTLEREIEGKLGAVYGDCEPAVEIDMNAEGFSSVTVEITGDIPSENVVAAEIRDLLCADYGIPEDVMKISLEGGK